MNHKVKCVLCDNDAITTVAHIPVCAKHDAEYHAEAKQYLPYYERKVYRRLLRADSARRRSKIVV